MTTRAWMMMPSPPRTSLRQVGPSPAARDGVWATGRRPQELGCVWEEGPEKPRLPHKPSGDSKQS